jgi:glycosyltransferase involved in cell wall biosynthesis
MRIALIAPFGLQPKGTVSARMVPLAQALAARGHMVRVVIPPWDDPSKQGAAALIDSSMAATGSSGGEFSSLDTVSLAMPRRVPYSIALPLGLVRGALRPDSGAAVPVSDDMPREIMRTLNALSTFRAEVVHVFKPVGYSGLAGLILSALRVPWVLDTDDWEGPGGWADVNPYSPLEKLSVTLMEAALPRMAGAVTAASRTLEARAWNMGLPRHRVAYLPNAVWRGKYAQWSDMARHTGPLEWERDGLPAQIRLEYGLGDSPVVVLYTRFAEYPYRWALRVFRGVLSEHPRARLLVVGSGFSGEEERLREEAARLGMGGSVAVTGRVPEHLVPVYLSLGDVALYPMADTLLNRAKSPMKVLEPMLMGLPVVAHRVGQAAEFVGDTGVLVRPGDLRGMAAGVSALLSDPQRRHVLGARAQQRVWAEFNWERLSADAERLYRQVMA